jgi:hypothetical protein
MVQPRLIVVFLIACGLSGCGAFSMFDTDTTASFNAAGDSSGRSTAWMKSDSEAFAPPASVPDLAEAPNKTAAASAPPSNSLFTRAVEAETQARAQPKPEEKPQPKAQAEAAPRPKPVTIASAEATPSAGPSSRAAEKVAPEQRGHAYLFRGVAGLIYSRGIDQLAQKINRTGVTASVDTYLMWRGVAATAVREYHRDHAPITIIGHSAGGDSAVALAEYLNSEKIPVSLLVTYDPTRIADDVPPNVERYINIFQSRNIMGGGNVVQGRGFRGHYASYNLKDHSEIVHINIEKAEHIQEQLVTKVAQLSMTPASGEGEALPLRYEVPANASIELWDSGMPVFAHDGDTLHSLAETYHVPLWALAQLNRVSEHDALSDGQRIIVPRHLVPMPAAVTSYAPTAR